MTLSVAMTLLTCLVGAGVSILLAAVPWAYSVHGRLTKIETHLKETLAPAEQIRRLEHRLTRIELTQGREDIPAV